MKNNLKKSQIKQYLKLNRVLQSNLKKLMSQKKI